jgi:hypothetical protein
MKASQLNWPGLMIETFNKEHSTLNIHCQDAPKLPAP